MGTWDATAFGNDSALDWVDEFEDESSPLEVIKTALKNLIDQEDYLDFDDCAPAFAAVALIAAAVDGNTEEIPEEIIDIMHEHREDLISQKADAVKVINRLKSPVDNEILQLWIEGQEEEKLEDNELFQQLDKLLHRLDAA